MQSFTAFPGKRFAMFPQHQIICRADYSFGNSIGKLKSCIFLRRFYCCVKWIRDSRERGIVLLMSEPKKCCRNQQFLRIDSASQVYSACCLFVQRNDHKVLWLHYNTSRRALNIARHRYLEDSWSLCCVAQLGRACSYIRSSNVPPWACSFSNDTSKLT